MVEFTRWIEGRAGLSPERVAVHFEGTDVTFAELVGRGRRLAEALDARLGVRRGDRVAHLGFNSVDYLDLLIACARLGAILLPLNWRLAPPELGYIIGHAEPKVLLAEADFRAAIDQVREALGSAAAIGYGFEGERWQDYAGLLEGASADANVGAGAAPEDALLLVYTSGTTGRPKGALLSHRAIFHSAVQGIAAFDISAGDHVLNALPLFHVGGINIQMIPALHAGASMTLHRRFEPGLALRDIAERRPSLFIAVPAMIDALIHHPDWAATDLSSLKTLTTGSSTIAPRLIEAVHARGLPVTQVYGSTETAPLVVHLMAADAWRKPGSSGRPAIHCRMKIVDDDGNEVAPGVAGEILVRGPNIMSGYWRDADATAEALRDGWFHSGDVGHCDDEGFLYVDDRKKDIIISGGENIPSAELEAVLAECAALVEAAVVAGPDARWGEIPVAVVVAKPDAALDAAAVIALFDGRLARYKHPKQVRFVERLPRNAMGKVLKHELRAMIAEEEEGAGR